MLDWRFYHAISIQIERTCYRLRASHDDLLAEQTRAHAVPGLDLPFNRILELADWIVTLKDGRIVKDVRPAAKT